MDSLRESSQLHDRARAFVRSFERGEALPESFDLLACDIARFQAEHIEGFARLCMRAGVLPSSFRRASDIPPVPTEVFKLTRVATHPQWRDVATFRTSGTTQGARGTHAMRDIGSYDAAALAFGRRWLVRDLSERIPVIVLGPSPVELPDSSLVHMCERFARVFGTDAEPRETFLMSEGVIDLSMFDERVSIALAKETPVLVLGTSFAFVHLLEALEEASFELPAGSRVMQTGGYKGKGREVPRDVLRRELARAFRIDERSVVSEYGMTELSSQFYERTLFDRDAEPDTYAEPPWARVVPVDPETLAPVPDGEIGVAKIIDLMNVDSAVAIVTEDRVRRVGGESNTAFELLGRAPGAPPRGCSIGIDELRKRTES